MPGPGSQPLDLERHLRETRIAGAVATPRRSNVSHAAKLAAGDPVYELGLKPTRTWTYEEVVACMAERVGIDPDATRETGADTIDAQLTVAALTRMRDRLAKAASGGERVLLATGHPDALMEVHLALALAFRLLDCPVLTPAAGLAYETGGHKSERSDRLCVRYLGGVAAGGWGGSLFHSHSPVGMETVLAALAADGDPPPDLVIADHGFAGAAAAAGLDVVCFADSNDPALFVGEAEDRVTVTVPLDDGVDPTYYGPVIDFLLTGWADDAIQQA